MHILRTRVDANSPWVEIDTLVGPVGPKGEDGKDYILTEDDKQEIAEKVNLEGYATEEFVNKKVAEAALEGSEVDLSAYYTKSEVDNAIEEAQPDLTDYATKTELEAEVKAAINESVNLPNYYTKSEVDALIPEEVDLTPYALKTDIPSLEGYAKTADIPDVSGYALKTDIPDTSGFITSIPAEYITETELAAKGYQTQAQVLSLISSNLPASGEGVYY